MRYSAHYQQVQLYAVYSPQKSVRIGCSANRVRSPDEIMAGGTTTGRLSGSLGKGSSSGKAGFKVPKAAPASKTQVHRPPEPKWQVAAYRFKPKKELTQDQLKAARKLFFDIDIDMSGSIDAEELGVMLRTLGQNPTEDELCQLIVRLLHVALARPSLDITHSVVRQIYPGPSRRWRQRWKDSISRIFAALRTRGE